MVGVAQLLRQLLRKMGKVVELGKAHLSLLAWHVKVQSGLLRWHRQLFFAEGRVVGSVVVAVIVGLVDAAVVLRVDQGRKLTRGVPIGQRRRVCIYCDAVAQGRLFESGHESDRAGCSSGQSEAEQNLRGRRSNSEGTESPETRHPRLADRADAVSKEIAVLNRARAGVQR